MINFKVKMQEDKPDKPNFNRSAFWEFFYRKSLGGEGWRLRRQPSPPKNMKMID
jgi:hypothetical protein